MTEEELLGLLTTVDRALEACPGWKEIKGIAGDYPMSLDEVELTTGQQAVMTLWRVCSVDSEGRSTAPDIESAFSGNRREPGGVPKLLCGGAAYGRRA